MSLPVHRSVGDARPRPCVMLAALLVLVAAQRHAHRPRRNQYDASCLVTSSVAVRAPIVQPPIDRPSHPGSSTLTCAGTVAPRLFLGGAGRATRASGVSAMGRSEVGGAGREKREESRKWCGCRFGAIVNAASSVVRSRHVHHPEPDKSRRGPGSSRFHTPRSKNIGRVTG